MNQKKLVRTLRSRTARDIQLKRIGVRRWRLQFTTIAVKGIERKLVGQIRIYEGRTLRSVAMQALG